MTEQRSGLDRRERGRPEGGRRANDPIDKLETHRAEFVTVGHLAEYWGIHVRTLQRLIRKGQIATYRFGREFRIKREDALAFERTLKYDEIRKAS